MKIMNRDNAASEHEMNGIRLDRFKEKRIQASYYIGLITIITVVAAGLIGAIIDFIGGTKPLMMVAFVLASFPFNMFILNKLLKKKFK